MNTKQFIMILISLMGFSGIGFTAENEPNEQDMTAAMNAYLKGEPDFCLSKFDWPIVVSDADAKKPTDDAKQMPVLEKLGLVSSKGGESESKAEGKEQSASTKRYELTEEGKKYYIAKNHTSKVDGKTIQHTHDFCAGKIRLDKIVGWTKPTILGNYLSTMVAYTFTTEPVSWAKNREIQKVFPMLEKLVNGSGKLKLKQAFRLEGDVWTPFNPWETN